MAEHRPSQVERRSLLKCHRRPLRLHRAPQRRQALPQAL